jgi:hypothetical protein
MVRIDFKHWQRLRIAAFYQCKPIKTLLNEILDGDTDPVTLEKMYGED